eukprot:scaffold8000_cov135-Skeletonema_marinoi.AAC.2
MSSKLNVQASDSLRPAAADPIAIKSRQMGSAVDSFSPLLFKTFTLAVRCNSIVANGSRATVTDCLSRAGGSIKRYRMPISNDEEGPRSQEY